MWVCCVSVRQAKLFEARFTSVCENWLYVFWIRILHSIDGSQTHGIAATLMLSGHVDVAKQHRSLWATRLESRHTNRRTFFESQLQGIRGFDYIWTETNEMGALGDCCEVPRIRGLPYSHLGMQSIEKKLCDGNEKACSSWHRQPTGHTYLYVPTSSWMKVKMKRDEESAAAAAGAASDKQVRKKDYVYIHIHTLIVHWETAPGEGQSGLKQLILLFLLLLLLFRRCHRVYLRPPLAVILTQKLSCWRNVENKKYSR